MGTPHKHAEVIKAWADGAEIQFKRIVDPQRGWEDCVPNSPNWYSNYEYRVKPKMGRYRVALFNTGPAVLASSILGERGMEFWEAQPYFIKWLTDWMEYEV